VEFGAVRGISCVQCHGRAKQASTQPASQATSASQAADSSIAACPFDHNSRQQARQSCVQCHQGIASQYLAWRGSPHPKRLDWPPGEIDPQARDDTRQCADCHMTALTAIEGRRDGRDHRWGARRDLPFISSGLGVKMMADPQKPAQVRITLTNLSGHAYGGTTSRRGLRWEWALPSGPAQVAFTLSPGREWQMPSATLPALAPAEVRTIVVPLPQAPATPILRYLRNLGDPAAYSAVIPVAPVPAQQPAFMP
jgi:hypothetical protein